MKCYFSLIKISQSYLHRHTCYFYHKPDTHWVATTPCHWEVKIVVMHDGKVFMSKVIFSLNGCFIIPNFHVVFCSRQLWLEFGHMYTSISVQIWSDFAWHIWSLNITAFGYSRGFDDCLWCRNQCLAGEVVTDFNVTGILLWKW